MATEVIKIVDPGNAAGTDYTSLAAAVAGEARSLTASDEQLTIKCRCTGGTADGAVTVDGFTTDATRYVKIWTDPSESYRHTGTYPSGNKYRIEVSNESGIAIRDANIEIIGIAIRATDTGNSNTRGVVITTGSVGIKIDKCFIEGICSGTGTGYGIYAYASTATTHVTNTVVQGWASGADKHYAAIYLYFGTPYIYNCTFTKSYRGISSYSSGTHTIKNCAVFNNDDDFYTSGATQVIDHCASDDGDGTNPVDISPGATEADDWAACFTDYANGDFSLKSDSVCVDAGVDDPGSGLYSDDILGNARTSPWDIGAFEYVSAPSGFTGTLAATLAGTTLAATGALAITGTAAVTLAGATLDATGTLPITGALSATLASATLSSAGAAVSGITGSLAQTLADSTLSSTGTVAIAAALAQTLANATVSSSGSVLASGALGAILTDSAVSAAGAVAVSGSLASTLAAATISSSGTIPIIGAAAITLADATSAGPISSSSSARTGAIITPPPIQHPMYSSPEDMEKGALSPVWALWFQQMQTHAVTYQSEQFFEVYSGEFTDNDPAPGSVSWDKIKLKYNGVRYAVNANGNTNKKYIYWESTNPRVLSAADVLWLLTPTCILVGTNQSGTFVPEFYDSRRRVYNAIDEDGTVAAGKVDSFSLDDLAVTEQKLADLAVTLGKLADGAVDITKCASTISPPEIFAVLPAAGNQGRLVYLTTDNKIYRDTGSVWTLEVDGNDLKAASVIAGKVGAAAIGTTELAAKCATINKLAVVPDNICPDSAFQDESAWVMDEGWSFLVNDGSNLAHQMDVPKCAQISTTSLANSYHALDLPSFAGVGQTLRLRYKAYNNSNQTMYAGVSFKNVAGADISLIYDTLAPGSGHKLVSKQGVVPAGTVKLSFWARTDGLGLVGTMAIGEWKLDVAASADLVVDGAITTAKLYAGAVTTEKIQVTYLSGISVNIGTVTAGTITGTTFRTASDDSGNYMELSGTSMMGKDSGGSVLWSIDPQYGAFHLNDDSDATGAKLGQNGYNNTTTWGVAAYNIEEGVYADDDGFNGRIVLGTSVPAGARYAIVRVWPNGTGSAFIVFRFGTVYIEQIVGDYYTYWDKKTDDYIQEHATLYPSKLVYVPISRSALGKAYLYFAVLAPQPESIRAKLAGFII